MGNAEEEMYYCTYCAFYGKRNTGTRRDMIAHAYTHPIGDPRDMILPVGNEDHCPACGEMIDYCQGHGESGDPVGYEILRMHDRGVHTECHIAGCESRSETMRGDVG